MWLCKRIFKAVLSPQRFILILLIPISTALLIYALTASKICAGIKYGSYTLSAYTLIVVCLKLPIFFHILEETAEKNKYIKKYRMDTGWRITISLYTSFAINAAYTLLQLGLGIIHDAVWYYSMTIYYLLLSVMRFYLLRYLKGGYAPGEDKNGELHRYRFCGIVLVGMNLTLAVIVYYITWQNKTFIHHTITTIAMAAYTFTSFTMAIINLIRYQKYQSPILSAAKAINFAAAMVSMLTLETTMLTVFEKGQKENFNRMITGITGTVITLTILIMAIYMIVKSTGKLRHI